jgi:hypothetical protein
MLSAEMAGNSGFATGRKRSIRRRATWMIRTAGGLSISAELKPIRYIKKERRPANWQNWVTQKIIQIEFKEIRSYSRPAGSDVRTEWPPVIGVENTPGFEMSDRALDRSTQGASGGGAARVDAATSTMARRTPGAGPRTRVLSTDARDTRYARGSHRDRRPDGRRPARSPRTRRRRWSAASPSALPRH